jgi:hypothetical protein
MATYYIVFLADDYSGHLVFPVAESALTVVILPTSQG